MTSFDFVHVYPGVTVAQLFAALTDPAHQAAQDRANDVERREVLERIDDATRYRCESKIYPRRQLPALLRPLVRGPLEIHEIVTWDKQADALEMDVRPSILGGRSKIRTTVQLVADPAGVKRHYRGTVSVEVALVGGRAERAVIEDLGKSLELARQTTLAWLGRSA